MAYSYWELALYFFFYSFLGWLVEVGIYAIKEKRVCNRGILTLPLSFSYGISMVLLILLLGHSINLFMCVLSSVVHPLRLTFVEFYKNAGFEAATRVFTPLKNE